MVLQKKGIYRGGYRCSEAEHIGGWKKDRQISLLDQIPMMATQSVLGEWREQGVHSRQNTNEAPEFEVRMALAHIKVA